MSNISPVRPSSEDVSSQEKQTQDSTPSQPQQTKNRRIHNKTTILLVLAALVCIVSCIVIVYFANGKVVDEWIPNHRPAVQPTVLLALLAAIFGFCMKLVFATGVTIFWWRNLELPDTTLADLHYIWKKGIGEGFGDTLNALRCKPARPLLAVFIIITVVDLSDGPLLQRSIKTIMANHIAQYQSDWQLPSNITEGWAGQIDNTSPATLLGTSALDSTLQDWYLNRSLISDSCGGVCDGPVQAAGIDVNCSSSEQSLDLTAPQNVNTTLFSLSFRRIEDSNGEPVLIMNHKFMSAVDDQCKGTIGIETCSIRTATVAYDLHQDKNKILLANNYSYPRPLSIKSFPGDLPGPDDTPAGALAALEYFGFYYLQSSGTLAGFSNGSVSYEPSGTSVQHYMTFDFDDFWKKSCSEVHWVNATDNVLWTLHDVMFRMAWWSKIGMQP